MAQRDKPDCKVHYNYEHLRIAIDHLVRCASWKGITWRSDCTWGSPRLFAIVALLWAWSDEKLVADCFSTARRIGLAMFPQYKVLPTLFRRF